MRPTAFLPFLLEGAMAAVAVATGLLPSMPQSVVAGAVFPLDVLFDVKRSIGYAHSWPWLVAALLVSILVRSTILAAIVHLVDPERRSFRSLWPAAARLTAAAVAALFPGAALFFIGVVLRYAPFVWAAALLCFAPALLLARRAAWLGAEDVGRSAPAPYLGSFLLNAAIICLAGASVTALSRTTPWLGAAVLLVLAPVEAAFFLGWRAQVQGDAAPERSRVVATVTVAALIAFAVVVAGDRMSDDSFGNRTVDGRAGSLVLLGGVDSTSETGSLADLDPRSLGWTSDDAVLLSYSEDPRYSKADTRRDLDEVAPLVGMQIAAQDPPVALFGHSQAALILDRMILQDLSLPDSAVVVAAPPVASPRLNVPPPGRSSEGKPGGDLARGLSWLLDRVGLSPYDVDAPASPTNLSSEPPADSAGVRRTSVWALADSVWLDTDWRRDGEVNVVAISDHVGAVADEYALSRSVAFFAGEEVGADDRTWRGVLATTLRYAFAPWRP